MNEFADVFRTNCSKTLAKLANHIAKTAEPKPGSYPDQHAQVCNLGNLAPMELDALMLGVTGADWAGALSQFTLSHF